MTHKLKFRYVYGIPGKPETYFFRYFTIEEIEAGSSIIPMYDEESDDNAKIYKIISRDQFTGLKDNNGKEIYPNDKDKRGYQIQFINGAFYLLHHFRRFKHILLSECNSGIEIIGNTHGVKP